MSSCRVIGNLVGLGLLLSFSWDGAIAQPMPEIPHAPSVSANPFRQIEQPLGLKAAVILGGLGLIGLEVWWFLFSKRKPQQVAIGQNPHH